MGAAGAIAARGAWRSQRIMVFFMALDACCRGNALIYMRLKLPLMFEWDPEGGHQVAAVDMTFPEQPELDELELAPDAPSNRALRYPHPCAPVS